MAVVLAQAVVDALIAWDGRAGARSPRGAVADEADSARGIEWVLSVEALVSSGQDGIREEDERLRSAMGCAASESATRLLRAISGARMRGAGTRSSSRCAGTAPTVHPVINWVLREWASADHC